jgi:type IV secretory pathway VirB2 component (pilin)
LVLTLPQQRVLLVEAALQHLQGRVAQGAAQVEVMSISQALLVALAVLAAAVLGLVAAVEVQTACAHKLQLQRPVEWVAMDLLDQCLAVVAVAVLGFPREMVAGHKVDFREVLRVAVLPLSQFQLLTRHRLRLIPTSWQETAVLLVQLRS